MKTSTHHLYPRSRGGTSERNNLKYCTPEQHEAHHLLWANKTPKEIIDELLTCSIGQLVGDDVAKREAWVLLYGWGTDNIKTALIVMSDWSPSKEG